MTAHRLAGAQARRRWDEEPRPRWAVPAVATTMALAATTTVLFALVLWLADPTRPTARSRR